MIYFILVFILVSLALFKLFDLINTQIKSTSDKKEQTKRQIKPLKTDLTDIFKDISIEPYGCFNSLDEKFFLKQINPYTNAVDSGIILNTPSDTRDLIKQVSLNGFDEYANQMFNKYDMMPEGYTKNMNIIEIATLGKLAGYNYLSIYKLDEKHRGKIYLTFSPPMDNELEFNHSDTEYKNNISKPDLPDYTLTPKLNNYTNEKEKAKDKELSCGYPCLPNDKPLIFDDSGVTKQYMCGSVGFPDIKTPPRFAVYRITEKM